MIFVSGFVFHKTMCRAVYALSWFVSVVVGRIDRSTFSPFRWFTRAVRARRSEREQKIKETRKFKWWITIGNVGRESVSIFDDLFRENKYTYTRKRIGNAYWIIRNEFLLSFTARCFFSVEVHDCCWTGDGNLKTKAKHKQLMIFFLFFSWKISGDYLTLQNVNKTRVFFRFISWT